MFEGDGILGELKGGIPRWAATAGPSAGGNLGAVLEDGNASRDRASLEDHRLSVPGGSRIFFTARAYFDSLLDDVGHEGRIPHNGETVRTQRGLMLEKEPQDLREVMVFVRGTRHGMERCGQCGSLAANIFAGPVFFPFGVGWKTQGCQSQAALTMWDFSGGQGRRGMQRGEHRGVYPEQRGAF